MRGRAETEAQPQLRQYGIVAEGWHMLVWASKISPWHKATPTARRCRRTSGLGGGDEGG